MGCQLSAVSLWPFDCLGHPDPDCGLVLFKCPSHHECAGKLPGRCIVKARGEARLAFFLWHLGENRCSFGDGSVHFQHFGAIQVVGEAFRGHPRGFPRGGNRDWIVDLCERGLVDRPIVEWRRGLLLAANPGKGVAQGLPGGEIPPATLRPRDDADFLPTDDDVPPDDDIPPSIKQTLAALRAEIDAIQRERAQFQGVSPEKNGEKPTGAPGGSLETGEERDCRV